jgi:hypothetical protein
MAAPQLRSVSSVQPRGPSAVFAAIPGPLAASLSTDANDSSGSRRRPRQLIRSGFVAVLLLAGIAARLLLESAASVSRRPLRGSIGVPNADAYNASLPLIADLLGWTHHHCLGAAADGLAAQLQPPPEVDEPTVVPLRSWGHLICGTSPAACGQGDRVPAKVFEGCAASARADVYGEPPLAPRVVTCAGGRRCRLSESLAAVADADAVILYHVSLSRGWLLDAPARWPLLLWPPERTARNQLWALAALWESTAYYPAGAHKEMIAQFDYSVGSDRQHLAGFR